jgi:excisionase family DNA binding protein
MPRTLTLEEAGQVCKTTAETISEAIRTRGLPAARVGRAYVLIEDDVIAWLRTQYHSGANEGQAMVLKINDLRPRKRPKSA